jgi:hypothetical protein
VGFAESFNGHFTNILLKGHKVAGRTWLCIDRKDTDWVCG